MVELTYNQDAPECPHCGALNSRDLDMLIAGQPVEWDCDGCGKPIVVTKIIPAPVYKTSKGMAA